jgi:hypothetical protein
MVSYSKLESALIYFVGSPVVLFANVLTGLYFIWFRQPLDNPFVHLSQGVGSASF